MPAELVLRATAKLLSPFAITKSNLPSPSTSLRVPTPLLLLLMGGSKLVAVNEPVLPGKVSEKLCGE